MHDHGSSWARPIGALLLAATVLAGCDLLGVPADLGLGGQPRPSCEGVKILVEGAMPCEQAASRALAILGEMAPEQVDRGVSAIDVALAPCPEGEVPPQVDCGGSEFAYLVTVFFEPSAERIEASLTVALEPVTGRLLGIINPLVR